MLNGLCKTVRPLALGACVAVLALTTPGCGDKTRSYTPSVPVAEAAVRQALDAWKAGESAGTVAGTTPLVQVVDAGRTAGQTLRSYRLLGETRGPSGRTFAVELELANPEERVKTQYIVVGIDPLWVFRQEDYELLAHWDHHMPKQPTPTTPEADTGGDSSK